MWGVLLFAAFLVGSAPELFEGEAQWTAALVSRDAIIFLVSAAAFSLIPYKRKFPKISWAIWTIWQGFIFLLTVLEQALDMSVSAGTAISAIMAVVFFTWIVSRKSRLPRITEAEKDAIYYVFPDPDDLIGIITAMVTWPWAGVSVYANGSYWGFSVKRGWRRVDGKAAQNKLKRATLVRVRKIQNGDIEYLNSMLGLKWRMSQNCYSVVQPRFGKVSDLLN